MMHLHSPSSVSQVPCDSSLVLSCRLRLTVPNRKGPLVVNVEVFEVLPGKHITELSKVTGNTGARGWAG